MKTWIGRILGLLALLSVLVAPAAQGSNVDPKSAAGGASGVTRTGNVVSGTASIVGTADLGGGLDAFQVRCLLYNGATGLASQVGASIPATVPVDSRQDVPISCTLSATDAHTLQAVAGSFVQFAVEQGGNPGKVIARSPAIGSPSASVPAGHLRLMNPLVQVVSVVKEGSSFSVTGHYTVTAQGTGRLPTSANLGWFATMAPVGSGTVSLGSFALTPSGLPNPSGEQDLAGDFTTVLDTAGVAGFAGSAALYVFLPAARTVISNASFPTGLDCTAGATPSHVALGDSVTLSVACQHAIGALLVEWRDSGDNLVGTGASLSFVPATPGVKQYTATVTDDVGATISQLGIDLSPAPVSVTVDPVGPVAPTLLGVVSRKIHEDAGVFDLVLVPAPADPAIEPRIGGAGGVHTVVFTFDKPVTAAGAAVTEGTATIATLTVSGNDVVVGLAGVANAQYVTVSLTNVASADGGTGGSGSVRIGFLTGDVNGSRGVSVGDKFLVNNVLAQLVTAANFLRDVNVSGTLSLADVLLVNSQQATALP